MSTSAISVIQVSINQVLDLAKDRKDRSTKKYFEHETALMHDIKANGIRNALKAFRQGNLFQLVCGQTRLNAARRAGLQDVPVNELQGSMTPTRLLIEELTDNNMTEGFDTVVQGGIYVELMRENNWTQSELVANVPAAKPGPVSKALSIFENLVEDLKAKLRSGDIGPRLAYALSRIDPARQTAVYEAVKHMKVEAAEVHISSLLGGPKKPQVKPITIRTPNGIAISIPPDITLDAALADLALPTDGIKRAQKHSLPMSALPQLLRNPPASNIP